MVANARMSSSLVSLEGISERLIYLRWRNSGIFILIRTKGRNPYLEVCDLGMMFHFFTFESLSSRVSNCKQHLV